MTQTLPNNVDYERRGNQHFQTPYLMLFGMVCLGLFLSGIGLLLISLVARPYLTIVLVVIGGLVAIGLCCTLVLLIAWTIRQTGIWLAEREKAIVNARSVTHGDVVSYLHHNGQFTHISAIHESAKIKELPAPAPEPDIDTETILSLYHDHGLSYRTIASSVGTTYHQVQKVITGDRRKGEDRLKRKIAERNMVIDAD